MLDLQTDRMPKTASPDTTLAFLREGYAFISRQCDALGSDVFETRIMLHKVVCMRGPEAARLLYGSAHLTRVGSMPWTVLRLLQDKDSVQQLDDAAHLHRKSLFVSLLMDGPRVDRLAKLFREAWLTALPLWRDQGVVDLLAASNALLTRATLDWAEIPEGWFDPEELAKELASMVESTGHLGPSTVAALLSRNAVERRFEDLVHATRQRQIPVSGRTVLSAMAEQTHLDGQPVDPRTCAVELINVFRPIAAVSRYIVYAAVALERHPMWRERLAGGEEEDALMAFVEEVRRFYPFFPAVGAVARSSFNWAGREWKKGQWFLLDLYGTTHDARYFASPDQFIPDRGVSWRNQDYSFIPQGAGNTATTHRCPGEKITVRLMAEAVRMLTRNMRYRFPAAARSIRLDRIPARPEQTSIEVISVDEGTIDGETRAGGEFLRRQGS